MTPSKKGKTTVIRIEKVKKSNLDETQVAHMAGGQHSGLVINKQITGISCHFTHTYFSYEYEVIFLNRASLVWAKQIGICFQKIPLVRHDTIMYIFSHVHTTATLCGRHPRETVGDFCSRIIL